MRAREFPLHGLGKYADLERAGDRPQTATQTGTSTQFKWPDLENKLHKESAKHRRRKDGDIYVVVNTLQEVEALKKIPCRTHNRIGTIPEMLLRYMSEIHSMSFPRVRASAFSVSTDRRVL